MREVLGEDHICFFVHQVVERLELSALEQGYVEEGRPAYHPVLLLKVWLYAYVLGLTSARRLEQRVREDLAFRYLAGGATPDFLDPQPVPHAACPGAERSVHAGGGVGAFARYGSAGARRRRLDAGGGQCLVRARGDDEKVAVRAGLRFGGRFAAGRSSAIRRIPRKRRGSRSHRRRWQRSSSGWREIPRRLEQLRKVGRDKVSLTDADSRFLRDRKGFTLGYTATAAVSEDHLIVEQRVGQNPTDNAMLVPVVEAVEQHYRERPQKVSADSGYFRLETIVELAQRGPRRLCARLELGTGTEPRPTRAPKRLLYGIRNTGACGRKLRDPAGRAVYQRRKAIVEPVFGVLKQQRGMRQFRRRGLGKVAVEFALAATAFNLTRLWRNKPKLDQEG